MRTLLYLFLALLVAALAFAGCAALVVGVVFIFDSYISVYPEEYTIPAMFVATNLIWAVVALYLIGKLRKRIFRKSEPQSEETTGTQPAGKSTKR